MSSLLIIFFPSFVDSEAAGVFGSRPLYKMLGYFSIIGLLRLHCLLGDYYLALDVMSNIDLMQRV